MDPVCGFSMMCCLAHGELAWLFLEPDTGLDNCPRILLSCFRARISWSELIGSLNLGNVWVFVQLIFGPNWPTNQQNKTPKHCLTWDFLWSLIMIRRRKPPHSSRCRLQFRQTHHFSRATSRFHLSRVRARSKVRRDLYVVWERGAATKMC